MINKAIIEKIKTIVPASDILTHEPMAEHTTFKVGGPARLFIELRGIEQLSAIIPMLREASVDYFVLGNGSNILVGDKGYSGAILHIGDKMSSVSAHKEQLTAQAGASLLEVARFAADRGLCGFEFAFGIPGTIGGAVVMNAGAFGGEMAMVVRSVTAVDTDGSIVKLPREALAFGYRNSIFMKKPYVIAEVTLKLGYDSSTKIMKRMAELATKRTERQPLQYASAGSTFKRPEGGYAGELIMETGLGGFSIGGACVSKKHCGFIINRGDATACDIRAVISEVQDRVEARYTIRLEPEVIFLGEF